MQHALHRDPNARLGMPMCGAAGNIRRHAFFEDIDWDALEALQMAPPFVPDVKDVEDVGNFSEEHTEQRAELSAVDEKAKNVVKVCALDAFKGFSFTHPEMEG